MSVRGESHQSQRPQTNPDDDDDGVVDGWRGSAGHYSCSRAYRYGSIYVLSTLLLYQFYTLLVRSPALRLGVERRRVGEELYKLKFVLSALTFDYSLVWFVRYTFCLYVGGGQWYHFWYHHKKY